MPPEKKKRTREAAFKKQLALEQAARAAKLEASGAASSSQTGVSATIKAARKIQAIREEEAQSGKRGKKKDKELSHDKPSPFRYKSFNERLAKVKLNRFSGKQSARMTSGLDSLASAGRKINKRRRLDSVEGAASEDEEDMDDDQSLLYATRFGSALSTWRELNMSLPFVAFLRTAYLRSSSLPMLLHHRDELVSALLVLLEPISLSLQRSGDQDRGQSFAYEPAFDLLPRLAADLGGGEEFVPVFGKCLEAVLRIAGECNKGWTEGDEVRASDIIEFAFASATSLIKVMAPYILRQGNQMLDDQQPDLMRQTWLIFRRYLGYRAQTPAQNVQEEQEGEEAEEEGAEEDKEMDEVPSQPEDSTRPVKLSPHIRRFTSEALAHLVRTAAGMSKQQTQSSAPTTDALASLAQMMIGNVEEALQEVDRQDHEGQKADSTRRAMELARAVASVWAEACKVS